MGSDPRRGGGARAAGRPWADLRHEPRRFATSARFLLRSLNLRGPAFLLAFLAVTVGACVTATVLNLKAGLDEKMSRELRAYGPNLLLVPAPGAAEGTATLAAGTAPRAAAALGPAARLAPVLLAGGLVGEEAATIVGADFEALRSLYPGWRLERAGPASGVGDETCVVGASLAARAGLAPGGVAEVRAPGEAALRVAGVVSTGEAEDERLFVPLHVLQRLAGLEGRLSYVAVSVEGGPAAVERAAALLQGAIPGIQARPLRAIALAEGAILARLDRMMLLLTLVVLALSGLCLVTTLMSMVVERTSEIGLARAIGAGDGEIFRMFLGEVGLLGLFGALAGALAGAGLTRLVGKSLFGTAIEPRLVVLPSVLGAVLVICLLAVFIPLRRALSIQPADALRGD